MSLAIATPASPAPWNDLGQALPPKESIESWAHAAGMDWRICEIPVRFMSGESGALGSIHSFDEHKVLYRSDAHSFVRGMSTCPSCP